MRWIDADALITDLNKGLWGKDWDKVLAEAIINEAPSIDIVFCKDCEHYNAGFECLIEGYGIERSPMWFCADGEREGE